METNEYDAYNCPVGETIALISGRWKPIILYLVQHDINRFSLLQKRMPRVSKKILTEQLRELEQQDLINREVRVQKHPQEVVYSLTKKGLSLRCLIDQIFQWGTDNLLDEQKRQVVKSFVIS